MGREPKELVEMRRALGAQLAAFRQAAGLTQGQLAKVTFRDRSTVAHIETGRSRADERFWIVADESCCAKGVLLAGFHAWAAAKQDHEIRAQEAQLAQARAEAESLRAAAAPKVARDIEISEVAGEEEDRIAEQLVTLAVWIGGWHEPSETNPAAGGGRRSHLLASCARSGRRGAGTPGPSHSVAEPGGRAGHRPHRDHASVLQTAR
ncbi:MAG: helix-turn-helix transcriptional regulator [Pseudonocardiaceae bacterium]